MRTKALAALVLGAAVSLGVALHNRCYFIDPRPESDIAKIVLDLSSSRVCARSKAALDVQRLGPAGLPAVPRLVELLNDPDPSVRWRSVGALGHIGHFPPEVKEAVYRTVHDPNENARMNAIFAVSRMQFEFPSKGGSLRPIPNYRETERGLAVYLAALSDLNPGVAYKALLHLNTSQVNERGPEQHENFRAQLAKLSTSADANIGAMALLQLGSLLGADAAQAQIPGYKDKVSALASSTNGVVRQSAARMTAELEGKEYPVLLSMVPGSIEKYKADCDAGKPFTCYYYGELLLYRGETEEAFRYFEKDCSPDGRSAGAGCEKLGDRFLAQGNRKDAEMMFKRVSTIYGTKQDAPVKLGDLSATDGDQDGACLWYLTACRNGNSKGCAKGRLCPGFSKVESALAARTRIDIEKGRADYLSAEEFRKKGDIQEALRRYAEAHGNGFVLASLQLAELLQKGDDGVGALRVLNEGCRLLEPLACLQLGMHYENHGEDDKAREYYNTACVSDHLACSSHLASLEARLGNREAAATHLRYICETAVDDRRKSPCETLEKWSTPPPKPADFLKSCQSGRDEDCTAAARASIAVLDHEHALEYYSIACNRRKTESSCRGLLDHLWYLRRFDDYRAKVAELCAGEKTACLREAALDEYLNNPRAALAVYEKLCSTDKMPLACNKMKRVIVNTRPLEGQKTFFATRCDETKDPSSCSALAAIFSREKNREKRDDYLKKALLLTEQPCNAGDFEHCVGRAAFQCALGDVQGGEEGLRRLCEKNPKACRLVDRCKNAMQEFEDDITPRN